MKRNEETFALKKYNGQQGAGLFRFARSKEELLRLFEQNTHLWFKSNQGDARQCKVNGAVKTWKTQPDRFEFPIRYGLYEAARLSLDEAMSKILVEIGD